MRQGREKRKFEERRRGWREEAYNVKDRVDNPHRHAHAVAVDLVPKLCATDCRGDERVWGRVRAQRRVRGGSVRGRYAEAREARRHERRRHDKANLRSAGARDAQL